MVNALDLVNVSKKFPLFALKDISFNLPPGFIMGFIGQNGAGKTTTLKLILNMLRLDQGSINIFGQDHIQNEKMIKRDLGIVINDNAFVPEWTINELSYLLKGFYDKWDDTLYRKYLNDFHLDSKLKIKALSRGMKLKLVIATALSHDARLLILDEPTSGLDAVSRDELMDILADFVSDEQRAVLFSTHITVDLERIADYITFLKEGKLLFSGTKDELMEKYVMVKGDTNLLNADINDILIGLRTHSVGFDALVDRNFASSLPQDIVMYNCSLDDIIIRFGHEKEKKAGLDGERSNG